MTGKVALFSLGEGRFALPVERIVHIQPATTSFRLPLLQPGIAGLLIDRDEVVPVLEPARYFPGCISAEPALHVIFEADSGRVALPATRVLQMVECGQGSFRNDERTDGLGHKRVFMFQLQDYHWPDIDELLVNPCDVQSELSIEIEEA